ncbi:MAG: RHS repeat-associated core domain-containing protein, partial [Myxococcota bacterium]
ARPQDQIRRAALDLAGSVAWYAYNASGQRVRKRVDKGGVQEERIYVGGYEVWRKRTSSGLQEEERQTLHVLDDQQRIALVETLTVTDGAAIGSPTPRQRYQLADHLGTATLEVDEVGAVISYEEYHPFGTTSWWATAGGTEVSAKRYRYTGKERDEETGLAIHGARLHAAWLGRWTSADPAGLAGGVNRFAYVRGNPSARSDPTGLFDVVGFLATTATVSGAAATGAVADDATGVGVLDDVTLFVTVPIFAVSVGILGGIWLAGGFDDLAIPPPPDADLLREPTLPESPQLGGEKRPTPTPTKAPIRRIDEHGNEWTQAGEGSWEMTSHARGAPGGLGDRTAVFPDEATGDGNAEGPRADGPWEEAQAVEILYSARRSDQVAEFEKAGGFNLPGRLFVTKDPTYAADYARNYGGGIYEIKLPKEVFEEMVKQGAILPDPDPSAAQRESFTISPAGQATVNDEGEVRLIEAGTYELWDRFGVR